MPSALQQLVRARLDGLPARPVRPKKKGTVPKPYTKRMKGKTLEERFWLKVTWSLTDCWLWSGDRYTWVVVGVKRNPVLWAFERFTGKPVPEGCYVKPGCGHADCINPFHMEVLERGADQRKLDPAQVEAIRQDPRGNTEVAQAYGVAQSFVSMVRAGKRRQQRAGSSPVEAGVRDKAA